MGKEMKQAKARPSTKLSKHDDKKEIFFSAMTYLWPFVEGIDQKRRHSIDRHTTKAALGLYIHSFFACGARLFVMMGSFCHGERRSEGCQDIQVIEAVGLHTLGQATLC